MSLAAVPFVEGDYKFHRVVFQLYPNTGPTWTNLDNNDNLSNGKGRHPQLSPVILYYFLSSYRESLRRNATTPVRQGAVAQRPLRSPHLPFLRSRKAEIFHLKPVDKRPQSVRPSGNLSPVRAVQDRDNSYEGSNDDYYYYHYDDDDDVITSDGFRH
ncbi:hypothetical protein M0802_007372 [Mischocyttarus mexicanus]|nr:hypothetical protein M0802_007372 [Mischocyttarus mexicanus]